MAKVLVILADGFEEIEATSIIDVLRRADIEVITASLRDKEVNGANGIRILADSYIDSARSQDFDMIVLPGGVSGAEFLKNDQRVLELLREFSSQNKYIGAICAAPIALDSAGVLKGDYTCYPSYNEVIQSGNFRDDKAVVESDNILTSRGPGTAICFGLAIVKKLKGSDSYLALKSGLLADFC
jgi:4-methyl-5(b-hydroxyethyl)-thiazole monophosphate biosynthesis